MTSSKRLARIADVLYLLVGIFGGFAEGYVEPKMYAAGDATATAGNVVANAGLLYLLVVVVRTQEPGTPIPTARVENIGTIIGEARP